MLKNTLTWDLSDTTQRKNFLSIKDNLWIEGYKVSKNSGDAGLQLTYRPIKPLSGGVLQDIIDTMKMTVVKVDVDSIAFNYKPESAENDALNIRENSTTPILIPEYIKDVQNKPAAYVKNSTVNILVKIKVEPISIKSLKIKGVSIDKKGSLGDAIEKTVTFVRGISKEGKDILSTIGIDESEYVEFTIKGKTPDKVYVSEESWSWIVTGVNGQTVSDMEVERTLKHRIYILWDKPKPPWNQAINDKANPWVNALDFAIVSCNTKDKTTEDDIMKAITTKLYKIPYIGDSQCKTGNGEFNYTKYMKTTKANCIDSAVGLDATASILGIDLVIAKRKTFFFGFNFHCFVKKDNYVYDCCSAMSYCVIKMNYTDYINAGKPAPGSVETDEVYPLK